MLKGNKTCRECKWFKEEEDWNKKTKKAETEFYCIWERSCFKRFCGRFITEKGDRIRDLKPCKHFKARK
jgi:hypothetical protein